MAFFVLILLYYFFYIRKEIVNEISQKNITNIENTENS